MPFYDFEDRETGEVQRIELKMSELDRFKADNPHLNQLLTALNLGDPHRMGLRKPPDSFRRQLERIHKNAGPQSKINTI